MPAASPPVQIDQHNAREFIDSFDTILTDCDGVLWHEDSVIGEANHTLNALQSLGKKVFYVTNNSTKSRDQYASKCEKLGFKASKDNILSSAYVLAQYLKNRGFDRKVYVMGMSGIKEELKEQGIEAIGGEPEVYNGGSLTQLGVEMRLDPGVGAVAVGFDPHLSYLKVMRTASYLEDPQCLFLATNTDERFPVASKGIVYPGTGCVVRCVEAVAERAATVMGKPNTAMFNVIKETNNLDPKRTLMIGDRCNTDILFGRNCGVSTLLVMSGVTTQAEVERWCASDDPSHHSLLPHYCIPQLDHLLPHLPTPHAHPQPQ